MQPPPPHPPPSRKGPPSGLHPKVEAPKTARPSAPVARAPRPAGGASVRPGALRPPSRQVPAVPPAEPPAAPAASTGKVPRARASSAAARARATPRPSPGAAWSGLSLKWKIAAMAAVIVLVTGVLTFIVSYSGAVRQLDREIETRGIDLMRTIATVDPQVWESSSGGILDPVVRSGEMMGELLRLALGEEWNQRIQMSSAENVQLYNSVLANLRDGHRAEPPDGVKVQEGVRGLMDLVERIRTAAGYPPFDPNAQNLQDRWFRIYSRLQDTTRPAKLLANWRGSRGVHYIAVTVEDANRNPLATVRTTESDETTRGEFGSERDVEGIKVADGDLDEQGNVVPMRKFTAEWVGPRGESVQAHVMIRMDEIRAARTRLLLSVLMAILVAIALGVGGAIGLATLIVRPLQALTQDVEIVKGGDLDHETVPRSRDEVGRLARTFNDMTRALHTAHEQELTRKAFEHELSIAVDIQSNLLPKRIPQFPPFEVGAYYRPSKEVGGDYYDFLEIDDTNLGIIVADVSGKGIPGSLVMIMARTLFHMEADRTGNKSPADTLKHVNRLLARDIKKGMFVTALYCVMNRKTGVVTVCSAGHNPMVVWKAARKDITLVNPKGIALGFDKGVLFDRTIAEEQITLEPGDRLVGYTDGVVEAMNAAREEFGDKRFYDLVRQLADKPVNEFIQTIVHALDEHRGDAEQHDDITLMTIRRSP